MSSSVDVSCSTHKVPAQRTLSKICHHNAWLNLFGECHTVDVSNDAAGRSTFLEAVRSTRFLASASAAASSPVVGADHSGDWLDVLPTSERLQSVSDK